MMSEKHYGGGLFMWIEIFTVLDGLSNIMRRYPLHLLIVQQDLTG
jgi:hypothetical protein